MRCYLILISILFVKSAHSLTLSPMLNDQVVIKNEYKSQFKITNNYNHVMEYEYWIDKGKGTKPLYKSELLIGGGDKKDIIVPVWRIQPENLEVYRVCVKERPATTSQVGLIARACARLRLYWPASQLLKQQ